MGKRSKRPKWIEGEPVKVSEKEKKKSLHPMKFKSGKSKRTDTGKKLTRSHHTPNPK